ncbi:MAG TPA: hypothetical protein VH575_13130 [Gemmataceae bacterium]|jgi:hypothetical protein
MSPERKGLRSNYLLFDEFHLAVLVPKDLEDAACAAIQRTLESQSFRLALRRAVRQVIRQYPDLDPLRIRIAG